MQKSPEIGYATMVKNDEGKDGEGSVEGFGLVKRREAIHLDGEAALNLRRLLGIMKSQWQTASASRRIDKT